MYSLIDLWKYQYWIELKREIADDEQVAVLAQYFQKSSAADVSKHWEKGSTSDNYGNIVAKGEFFLFVTMFTT